MREKKNSEVTIVIYFMFWFRKQAIFFFFVLGLPIISRLYIDLNPHPIVPLCRLGKYVSYPEKADRCHDSQQG